MPFFSVITPTLLRPSLQTTCASLDCYSFNDYEHIVVIDTIPNEDQLSVLGSIPSYPRRIYMPCDTPHRNGGNTCRRNAYSIATGEWVIYLDDDVFLAPNILRDLHEALKDLPLGIKWALFPITRLGQRFYTDPPRSCHVDTLNVVLRHDVAQWPDTDAYGSDGVLVDELIANHIPYAAFPDFRPIGVIPKISFGK